ncbi:hypothetical protein AB0L40_23145 [Patulibacter sp. NPDC049589]|uniref:hypothetical protein n=1 Tax=Patulibacter sp. NPDC049589 TaxID=3154731 RepID=UPI00342B2468
MAAVSGRADACSRLTCSVVLDTHLEVSVSISTVERENPSAPVSAPEFRLLEARFGAREEQAMRWRTGSTERTGDPAFVRWLVARVPWLDPERPAPFHDTEIERLDESGIVAGIVRDIVLPGVTIAHGRSSEPETPALWLPYVVTFATSGWMVDWIAEHVGSRFTTEASSAIARDGFPAGAALG